MRERERVCVCVKFFVASSKGLYTLKHCHLYLTMLCFSYCIPSHIATQWRVYNCSLMVLCIVAMGAAICSGSCALKFRSP